MHLNIHLWYKPTVNCMVTCCFMKNILYFYVNQHNQCISYEKNVSNRVTYFFSNKPASSKDTGAGKEQNWIVGC